MLISCCGRKDAENQIYVYFLDDPTENDNYYLRLWISKSCFDVLSRNTRGIHGDQLVEVMLDHLMRTPPDP
jgi:hypothetical protein